MRARATVDDGILVEAVMDPEVERLFQEAVHAALNATHAAIELFHRVTSRSSDN
jgi:hypothetical protein